jgi:hypothetical protein
MKSTLPSSRLKGLGLHRFRSLTKIGLPHSQTAAGDSGAEERIALVLFLSLSGLYPGNRIDRVRSNFLFIFLDLISCWYDCFSTN